MAKTDQEFERQLDDLSPGTRETLIVAAHKTDVIWDDTIIAHGLDGAAGAKLRDYILRTYDPLGARLR
jgi:hypothetical protein